jgi:hypothetical protein
MCKRCRCNHKLNKCPKDVYVKFVSTSAPFTHVWTPSLWVHRHRLHMSCMNSRKEPFITYNSSMWIFSLYWLLNWFQTCFQSDTIVVSRRRPPYCLCWSYNKRSTSYERIKNVKVHRVMNESKTNRWQCSCPIKRHENDIN